MQIALEHVYDPDWYEVLQLLAGSLERRQAGTYVAALLRKNQEDVLCRPFQLAVVAVINAPADVFSWPFADGLGRVLADLGLRAPDWLDQARMLALMAAGGIFTL